MVASGCIPPELGECDETVARVVVYTDDAQGLPAYAGQALINQSCGAGAFCHSEGAVDRHGAPLGMDFDLALATDEAQTERLRRDQATAHRLGRWILLEVQQETMPPGAIGAEVAASGPAYRNLPALFSPEGKETLRNWLACGSPVVERVSADRPTGVQPVGAIVPALPATPPGGCTGGLVDCGGACVNTTTDPAHCGGCDTACDAASFCSNSSCTTDCPTSTTECNRSCVDTGTDPMNCGGCGAVCASGETCSGGACACSAGLVDCGSGCVDTQSSADDCGGCGMACASGEVCEAGTCVACGDSISFSRDVMPLFGGCTGSTCHSGVRPAGNLDLSSGSMCSSMVGVASSCGSRLYVEPGAPDRSYVVDKLRGRNLCRGQQMPLRAPALPESQIATIEDWICGGARND